MEDNFVFKMYIDISLKCNLIIAELLYLRTKREICPKACTYQGIIPISLGNNSTVRDIRLNQKWGGGEIP